MSRFLSGFWRGGGQAKEEEGSSAAAVSHTGAASWIQMKDPPGGRGEPIMTVNMASVDSVLNKLGDTGAVNVVAIFGAARGGKSFLMNQLAGQDDIFKISNEKDPCTQGVDMSRAVVPLHTFATLDGCTAPKGVSAGSQAAEVRVLFADVEGQGDRDAAYDARLASAILPVTKCVIFNWRDSLQVDRMLNLLGVMQRAAHNVDLGDDDEGTTGPKFGHLHVVFRDWNYQGTAEDVKKQLFGIDNRGMGSEVAVKNELRRTIKAAFASVTIWLFPPPVEMTSELSKELKSGDLSEGFVSQLASFRCALSAQLSEPTIFGPANPVTGHALGCLVPALVDVLNNGEIIMPQSAYQQMIVMELEQVRQKHIGMWEALMKTAIDACTNGPPVPPQKLEADMEHEIQSLLSGFESEAKALGAKDDKVAEAREEIKNGIDVAMKGLRSHNSIVLGRHLKTAVKEARAKFTEDFTNASRAKMPLLPSELTRMAEAASSRARGRLQAVPSAGPGDDSQEEALSALGDFVELAISKAERENDALVQAQGKKEEDAVAVAIGSFQENFKTDLEAVKAGGGPYQLASVEAAEKAALDTASTSLRRALVPADGAPSDRVASLIRRLEERAGALVLEERSEFDRSCAAYMMMLSTKERRRLREETKTDVYPLLPLKSTPELEAAFQPVVKRMIDRIHSSARLWALSEQMHAQHIDSAKSDAESVWQSLFERNERFKLKRENENMGLSVQRNEEEARRLRLRLGEERRKAQEAEKNASDASAAAAQARLAATAAQQRARQAVGARDREVAAREEEKLKEAAMRAEERERTAAEVARLTSEAAAREAKLVAEAAAASAAVRKAEQAAERARAAASASAGAEAAKGPGEEKGKGNDEAEEEGFEDAMDVQEDAGEVGKKEENEEEEEEAVEPRPKRARRKTATKVEKMEKEEDYGEEPSAKRATRTSSRRKTIMTPIGKDPAALKAAREEAAQKIKDTQDKNAGKLPPAKKEEDTQQEEEADSGLTRLERSRKAAAQWAEEQKVQKAKKAAEAKNEKAAAAAAAAEGESSSPAPATAATPRQRTSGRRK